MRGSNPCVSNDDCRLEDQGYVCRRRSAERNKYCRTKGNDGSYCDTNQDCEGNRCNNNQCVSPVDHCQTDSDCRDMMICDDKGEGKDCYGYESYECDNDNDCGIELYCGDHEPGESGYCYMRGSSPCDSDSDCRLRDQDYVCRRRSADRDKFCRVQQGWQGYCEREEDCADNRVCRWNTCEGEDQREVEETGVTTRIIGWVRSWF